MKKIIKIPALIIICTLIGLSAKAFIAYAKDNSSGRQEIQNKDNHGSGGSNDQKNDGEDEDGQSNDDGENEDGQSNDEHDIFSLIVANNQKTPALALPEIDEKSILTYADVVNVLKSYEKAVSQISINAGVDTQTANLTAGERALLNGLLNKHHNQFNRLNIRITLGTQQKTQQ